MGLETGKFIIFLCKFVLSYFCTGCLVTGVSYFILGLQSFMTLILLQKLKKNRKFYVNLKLCFS